MFANVSSLNSKQNNSNVTTLYMTTYVHTYKLMPNPVIASSIITANNYAVKIMCNRVAVERCGMVRYGPTFPMTFVTMKTHFYPIDAV